MNPELFCDAAYIKELDQCTKQTSYLSDNKSQLVVMETVTGKGDVVWLIIESNSDVTCSSGDN